MKTLIKSICIFSFAAAITGCGSTPKQEAKAAPQHRELTVISSQPKVSKDTETPASLYAKKVQDIQLVTVSSPAATSSGKAFASPFVFKAQKADGSPVAGLELALTYPESRNSNGISFALQDFKTDENGTISFTAPVPTKAYDSIVRVYPQGDITDPEIAAIAEKLSASASYKVKTDKLYAGGTIAIVDFNQNDKPITNNSVSSSNLLMALMRQGFKRIGNADFTQAILQEDNAVIYKSAKALLGNNSAFIVYGTVKYDQVTTKTEDGKYTCSLSGKITCMDMSNGAVLYQGTDSVTVTEDKEWNCLPNARKALADKFAVQILYGL